MKENSRKGKVLQCKRAQSGGTCMYACMCVWSHKEQKKLPNLMCGPLRILTSHLGKSRYTLLSLP